MQGKCVTPILSGKSGICSEYPYKSLHFRVKSEYTPKKAGKSGV